MTTHIPLYYCRLLRGHTKTLCKLCKEGKSLANKVVQIRHLFGRRCCCCGQQEPKLVQFPIRISSAKEYILNLLVDKSRAAERKEGRREGGREGHVAADAAAGGGGATRFFSVLLPSGYFISFLSGHRKKML
jgi:hypothetical protein